MPPRARKRARQVPKLRISLARAWTRTGLRLQRPRRRDASQTAGQDVEDAATLVASDVDQLDLATADQGIPDIDRTIFPSGFDDAEFRAAADYEDIGFDSRDESVHDGPYYIISDDDDDDGQDYEMEIEAPVLSTTEEMAAPTMPGSRRASDRAMQDNSVLIQHRPNPFIELPDFELALGLMTHITGTSTRDWVILREVMSIPGAPQHGATRLPHALVTLKKQVSKMMPLLDMRVANVALNLDKLPTLGPTDKAKGNNPTTAKMHLFDPTDLFKTVLASQLRDNLHLDMAHYVDHPTELYHSRSWASSVRTSSGHYAHMIDRDGDLGDPIFPSDWVYYSCDEPGCQCTSLDVLEDGDPDPSDDDMRNVSHIDRVVGFGKMFMSNRPALVDEGGIVLEIEQAVRAGHYLFDEGEDLHGVELEHDELLLGLSGRAFIGQGSVIDICHVTVDRLADDERDDPAMMEEDYSNRQPFVKYPPKPMVNRHPSDRYIVRRVFLPDGTVDWFCRVPALRAELEFQVYGRSLFAEKWDRVNLTANDPPPISLPCTTFIDGFGLF